MRKSKAMETISFRVSEEVYKFIKKEVKKDKSRFLEYLLILGIEVHKRRKNHIIN